MSSTRDIREAVEAELRFDPLVDSSDIAVENLGGDVVLPPGDERDGADHRGEQRARAGCSACSRPGGSKLGITSRAALRDALEAPW